MPHVSSTQRAYSSTWCASLALDLQGSDKKHKSLGTRLMGTKHVGPLYVQKPFYPEGRDHAHIYLLHPPGGLVSGDDLFIDIKADNGAGALITTPGAAKAYRARSDQSLQSQKVQLTLNAGSCLEWFPQESIIYSGANTQMDMQVTLSPDSSYIGWEILCLGLPHSHLPFEQGQVNLCLQLFEANRSAEDTQNGQQRLLYRDNLYVQAGDDLLHSACGFKQCPVSAYLVAKFPADKEPLMPNLVERMRARLSELNADELIAVTVMGSICVSRYLGHSTSEAKNVLIALWKIMRPVLINREATLPRIWYT